MKYRQSTAAIGYTTLLNQKHFDEKHQCGLLVPRTGGCVSEQSCANGCGLEFRLLVATPTLAGIDRTAVWAPIRAKSDAKAPISQCDVSSPREPTCIFRTLRVQTSPIHAIVGAAHDRWGREQKALHGNKRAIRILCTTAQAICKD